MTRSLHRQLGLWAATWSCLAGLLAGCAGGEPNAVDFEVWLPEPDKTERVEVFLVSSCGPDEIDPGKRPSQWIASVYTLRDGILEGLGGSFVPGTYGLYAVAQDGDCAVIAQDCVELELDGKPREPVALELQTWSGTGCARGLSCSLANGQCAEPVTDCSGESDGTGCLVEDVAGLCRQGQCCTGCWTGSACVTGDETARCGLGGELCQLCECDSDLCIEGECSPMPAYKKVSAGEEHSCAIADTGELWCWGSSSEGQLGIGEEQGDSCGGNVQCKVSPTLVSFEVELGRIAQWSELSAGQDVTCATLATDSSLWCWGSNDSGRMGAESQISGSREPYLVNEGSFTHLEIEQRSGCAIASDRSLWCWGDNGQGQSNPSSQETTQYGPAKLQFASEWSDVAMGFAHACATKANGDLWCWGSNSDGQLGNGETGFAAPPQVVASSTAEVTAFNNSSCAHTEEQKLLCWGRNNQGQLGLGDETGQDILSPAPVAGDQVFVQVSGGESFACGITDSGRLFCWGQNNYEQLGIGADSNDVSRVYAPTQVGTNSDWASVSVGQRHACAIKTSGTLWCWGDNNRGQLGLGYRLERPNMPTRICF